MHGEVVIASLDSIHIIQSARTTILQLVDDIQYTRTGILMETVIMTYWISGRKYIYINVSRACENVKSWHSNEINWQNARST